MRTPVIVIVALALLCVARPDARQETPSFSVRAELVVLQVTVNDREGAFVRGLRQDAFAVAEDGMNQDIAFFADVDAPVTVGLLVDGSGSMLPVREVVAAGAEAFAHDSHPLDEIFALTFNERIRTALPPEQPFTTEGPVLRAALERVMTGRGRTALYDAVVEGVDYLNRGTRARKALIVVSDGGDNASRTTREAALRRAQQSSAVIYTVAVLDAAGRDANPRLLKTLAEESGGRAFRADTRRQITTAFREVAEDIRHAYTLGYVPPRSVGSPGFRRVRVSATGPDGRRLVVRTRAGYVTEAVETGR